MSRRVPVKLTFKKTGKDIKEAIKSRRTQLKQRLEKRNMDLDVFMQDMKKLRSYLVRSSENDVLWMEHRGERPIQLYSQDDISSEEREEISQLCRRIFEIEQERYRLALIATHLADEEEIELSFEDLVAYGFDVNLETD